uniref:BED-type domain-containing protein n=1 Tax=Fagus sylvatica TaxID=28930 RepID=A0A2N9IZP9_FAGSY
MGRKKDQFWKHVEKLNGRFKCEFCNNEFPGGASRIKSHLAGVKGHDIAICKNVPRDVQEEAYLAIGGPSKKLKISSTSSDAKDSKTSSTSMSKTTKGKAVTQSNEERSGEIVLNVVVVDGLVDKLRSFAAEHMNINSTQGFREELIKLLLSLTEIQVVLHDAEKRLVSNESVTIWLPKLRDVAYDIDDMLYEVRTSFSLSNTNKENIIKTINQSLDRIKNGFGLGSMDLIPNISLDREIDSFLNDLVDVGRGCDVSNIVRLLTSASNQQISILPIVGMPGIGKTTLTKIVYNHARIRKHFDVLAWVRVTKSFNVERILSEILKSLGGGHLIWSKYGNTTVQELQNRLWSKKYLLVLDDVWNEDHDEWDTLRSHLSIVTSNIGNNIIVTTHSDKVAKLMGTLDLYYLEKLSKDECWSIFEKIAFANERIPRTPDLEAIGREIAKKCGGLPLAARVLGGTTYFKDGKSEWLSIQDNKLWDLLDDDNNGVFPILKLGFDYLPTSLKQCFAYCAIFPKDYNMEKDELIQHWMAEGFLEPFRESCAVMEDIGNMYFNILLANTFFQDARKDTYGNIISCKMNDLMYDFALSISKFEIQILEGGSMNDINHVRRLVVRSDGKAVPEIPILEDGFTKLHTLVSEDADFGNMLSNFKCLRVLKCGCTKFLVPMGRVPICEKVEYEPDLCVWGDVEPKTRLQVW